MLRYPENIVDIPETVPLILGDGVPLDVGFSQLKVWAYTSFPKARILKMIVPSILGTS